MDFYKNNQAINELYKFGFGGVMHEKPKKRNRFFNVIGIAEPYKNDPFWP